MESDSIPLKKIAGGALLATSALVGLTVVFGSWFTIDERERGVLLRNGAFVRTLTPGLGFKTPWIESVVEFNLETKSHDYKKLNSYSFDQQVAEVDVTVVYRILPDGVDELYQQYGTLQAFVDRRISNVVPEKLKEVFGQYNAVTLIQNRAKFNSEARSAIINEITRYKSPVIIEDVKFTNIDFSNEYEKSIEARMKAEVEVQQFRQTLEREKVQADIKVTQASAVADSLKKTAEAEAYSTKVRGDAEAESINARGKALRDNPALVSLIQAERWDGKLPVTMIPGGSIPMINLQQK